MNETKKKKGSAGCEREFSPWHDEDGEFASPEEKPKGSWSCQEKGQSSRRGRSRRFTKVPCGRKAREQGKNVRCHDGKVLSEEFYSLIRQMVERELVESQVQRGQEEEPVLMHLPTLRAVFKQELETRNGELLEMDCGKCVEQYLRSLNAAIKASKGELGKK